MFVKVSGWVVVRNCGVVLMFWELVGDRMMFVRDEFFYHTVIWFIRWCLIIFLSSFIWWGKVLNLRGAWPFSKGA